MPPRPLPQACMSLSHRFSGAWGQQRDSESNVTAFRAVGQARGSVVMSCVGAAGTRGPACAWRSVAMCGVKSRCTQRSGWGRSTGSLPGGTHPAPELGAQLAGEVKEPLAGPRKLWLETVTAHV